MQKQKNKTQPKSHRDRLFPVFAGSLVFSIVVYVVVFYGRDLLWYFDLSWKSWFDRGLVLAGVMGFCGLIVLARRSRSIWAWGMPIMVVVFLLSVANSYVMQSVIMREKTELGEDRYYLAYTGFFNTALLHCDKDAWRVSDCEPCWTMGIRSELDSNSVRLMVDEDAGTVAVTATVYGNLGEAWFPIEDSVLYDTSELETCSYNPNF